MIQPGMAEDHAISILDFCTLLRAQAGRVGGGRSSGAFSVEFDTKSINSVGENV